MAEIFDFAVRAEPSGQRLYRTIKAPFGDGYTQVAPDGINTNQDSWNLSARGYLVGGTGCGSTGQDVRGIMDFLDARNGAEAFGWVAPDGLDAMWLCEGYSITKDAPNIATLTFTFYRTYFA